MADSVQNIILAGLQQAAAQPRGLPLTASKGAPGLFLANAAGKKAGQHCLDQGWLRTVRTEPRGKTSVEFLGLTDAGLAYLLDQVHPRHILTNFIEAVEARRRQLDDLLDLVRIQQESLTELGHRVDRVLSAWKPEAMDQKAQEASPKDKTVTLIMDLLDRWQRGGSLGDCPLPHLYKACPQPATSIGQFHDAVRRLHDDSRIYLHPWTGPLYEIPEPSLALLTGHEIAYYASPRRSSSLSA